MMEAGSGASSATCRFLPFSVSALSVIAVLLVPCELAQAAAGRPLLLLADKDTAGTDALEEVLTAAGFEVTRVLPEYSWDGTNPPLDAFHCVVHLNGATWQTPLPVAGQTALVDFVRNGGGFIGGQFNGYEKVAGQQVDMNDLVLQEWPHPDNCTQCSMTWTQVPAEGGHPVLEGLPESFTFFADSHDAGPLVQFGEYASVVLMTSPGGGPAIVVRELDGGRIVSFSSAANASTDLTLQDFNIQTLYVNAAEWTCRSLPSVPRCEAPTFITPKDAPVSFTATAEGIGLEVEITDYDCYKFTKKGKRIDKTGSCRVSYTGDTVTIEESGGVGTFITWTAVSVDRLGNRSEEADCQVFVARPGKGRLKPGLPGSPRR